MPESPALLALGEMLSRGARTQSGGDDILEASDACRSVGYWRRDRDETMRTLGRDPTLFLRLALTWMHRMRRHPWLRPLGADEQLCLRPALDEVENAAPAAGYWGDGVWRPRYGGLWTSTLIPGASPWLLEIEREVGRQLAVVTASDRARILEVDSKQGWGELVAAYPSLAEPADLVLTSGVIIPGPLYLPSWADVSNDWDAVRVSVKGKLRCQAAPMALLDGYTVLHEDTGFEETVWLKPVFASVEPFEE